MSLSYEKHPDWEIRTDIKGWYLHDDVKKSIRKVTTRLNKMWKDIANFEKYTNKIIREEFGDALVLEDDHE